jgi:IclR family transcriptional regulator, pca regulon regulatory protein
VTAGVSSLEILSFLVSQGEPATAPRVADGTGIPRATTYRLLRELAQDGWVVERDKPRGFEPTLRVAELGFSSVTRSRARDVALCHAIELSRRIQRFTTVCLYAGGDIFRTDVVEVVGDRVMPMLQGVRAPAITSATGKVLLAYQDLAEIKRVVRIPVPRHGPMMRTDPEEILRDILLTREQGYGATDGEWHANVAGLAVPVFDQSGHIAAAIGFSAPAPLQPDYVSSTIEIALGVAARASVELGYREATRHLMA